MIAVEPILVVTIAFIIDLGAGDPPNRFHPVAWMGSVIAWYRHGANIGGNAQRFIAGLLLVLAGTALAAGIGWLVQTVCNNCWLIIAVFFQSIVLKSTFSAQSLAQAAKTVAEALDANNVALAREQVAFHLVSRDVSSLGESDLSAATVESVAENSSDSLVAPLFYFMIAGLPGALVYRYLNTCDAMLGYRTAELEWFGKPAARLDDLLNLVPSRLTALIILCIGTMLGTATGFRKAVSVWWRDHALTASPNAGHPMSAAAGVLGVSLEKRGHYRLGAELPRPSSRTIVQSIKLLWGTAVFTVLVCCIAICVRGWI